MPAIATLSQRAMIVHAAHDLEQGGQTPFSAEALIVRAWQKYPKTFGIKGWADQHPCSNKVIALIVGDKGLVRSGLLDKTGAKLYTLTPHGRRLVRQQEGPAVAAEPTTPTDEQERQLLEMLGSAVAEKYATGLKLDLTFADACRFWGVRESQRGDELDHQLESFHEVVVALDRLIGPGGVTCANGRHVPQDEMKLLRRADDYLHERFGRHISLLRNRQTNGVHQ